VETSLPEQSQPGPPRRKLPQEASLEIIAVQADGLGVSQLNERPVLVKNALKGEVVHARIVKKRRGVRFADGLSVAQPNADRVRSACSYFPRCGGCAMHHIALPAQLRLKEDALRSALAEVDVRSARWRDPVSLTRLGYRRKARLGVRSVGGQLLVGFRESFSNRVARMDHCEVLTPTLSRLIAPLKTTIERMSQPAQIPQIELAEGDTSAAIMVRHLYELTADDEMLWREFADAFDIQVLLQDSGYDSLRCVWGDPVRDLHYQIPEYGITMDFHPAQFTQVNAAMNRELVRTALGYLGNVSGKAVADLFCGIGNFSLPLARSGATVVGYEAAAQAVDQAAQNASKNDVALSCTFEVRDLYTPEGELSSNVDAVLLDPPRSGAGPNLKSWLGDERCAQMVYVSCNPKTFAEDARVVIDQGFELVELGIYDMFPQTAHVETVGYFERG
jgi:23S rRNA (uracil1939-C5)-methyltransferase